MREQGVTRADQLGEPTFEGARSWRKRTGEDAALEHAQHAPLVTFGHDGPEPLLARRENGLTAQDGGKLRAHSFVFRVVALAQSSSMRSCLKGSCSGVSPGSECGDLKNNDSWRCKPFSPLASATWSSRTKSTTS